MAVSAGTYLAMGSAFVSATFSVLVFRQFAARRKAYSMAWGLGLALFTAASAMEVISELSGWTVPLYRAYFALHPTLVAVLGLGTVYLLANKRIGHAFLAYILVMLAILLFYSLTATVLADEFVPGRVVGGRAMPDSVRSLSQLFTYPGSIALIGGALYSWRKTRWSYNLLIGVGAVLMAMGGVLTRYFSPEFLYIFLLVGIAVMFGGFLRSLEVPHVSRAEGVPSSVD